MQSKWFVDCIFFFFSGYHTLPPTQPWNNIPCCHLHKLVKSFLQVSVTGKYCQFEYCWEAHESYFLLWGKFTVSHQWVTISQWNNAQVIQFLLFDHNKCCCCLCWPVPPQKTPTCFPSLNCGSFLCGRQKLHRCVIQTNCTALESNRCFSLISCHITWTINEFSFIHSYCSFLLFSMLCCLCDLSLRLSMQCVQAVDVSTDEPT